ncbi:molecular chaperone IbpA [Bradyrhizobium sp. S3.9.1]
MRDTLETFFGLPNFFGVATPAIGTPSGSRHSRRAPVVSGAAQPFCSLEDLAMRTADFSPLFRSAIGFDRLFDLAEAAQRAGEESYPPYNIERLDENRFQISVALAGFKPDEVDLTVEQNVLTLESRKSDKEERTFLHRGISARNFKRQFTLADHVEVKGASFENGLLVIDLQREIPEAKKPRRIAINGVGPNNVDQIEAKAA